MYVCMWCRNLNCTHITVVTHCYIFCWHGIFHFCGCRVILLYFIHRLDILSSVRFSNSPPVCLHLSVRTRGPWLEVIEAHTRVGCCCFPRRTPASPQLCATVHLHTNSRYSIRSAKALLRRGLVTGELHNSVSTDCNSMYMCIYFTYIPYIQFGDSKELAVLFVWHYQ